MMDRQTFELYVSMLYLQQSIDKVKAILEKERIGSPSPVEVTAFPDGGKNTDVCISPSNPTSKSPSKLPSKP